MTALSTSDLSSSSLPLMKGIKQYVSFSSMLQHFYVVYALVCLFLVCMCVWLCVSGGAGWSEGMSLEPIYPRN